MQQVLVLGGGGFIGHHLVNRLKQEGKRVFVIDLKYPDFSKSAADKFIIGDLVDYQTLDQLSKEKFTEIYQLAADMGGATYIFTGNNDAYIMQCNAQINLNLLRWASLQQKEAVIFFSSSACVYPIENQLDSLHPNCAEDSVYPANPDSEYGWEKLFSERLFLAAARNNNLKIRIARYHNIYGPMGIFRGHRAKSIAALCQKVIEAQDSIEIIGPGTQTRSYLYIDDCIDATLQLVRSNYDKPINIGSEEIVTINDLVDLILSLCNKKLNKIHVSGPVGVMGRTSDNRNIKKYLNWQPTHDLAQGLAKTYSWIKAQMKS